MKRRLFLAIALTIAVCCAAYAQRVVQLNGHSFVPEQNAGTRLRGASLGEPVNGQQLVMVQFSQIPDKQTRAHLEHAGLVLRDYIGGYAYYALLRPEANPSLRFRGGTLSSLVALRPEWKVNPDLAHGHIPPHARVSSQSARVDIRFFTNITEAEATRDLQRIGMSSVRVNPQFGKAVGVLPLDRVQALSQLAWVANISFEPAPMRSANRSGLILSRGHTLQHSRSLGGRQLTGEGVRVGIWDENVMPHPDFGDRVTIEEYEFPPMEGAISHGTHVAGTVLGSGLLNREALGMAPNARAWTYNFNVQSNGLQPPEEMAMAYEKHAIQLTQNSYGLYLAQACHLLGKIPYQSSDYEADAVGYIFPDLVSVYAAGNYQLDCAAESKAAYGKSGYGTMTRNSKNIIAVGAVDNAGRLTDFSSCGPLPDGRIGVTVTAKGAGVLSTQPQSQYAASDGTSMSCPTVSGLLALVAERYAQLHPGQRILADLARALVANTADDTGRPGPDFQYGYGIMNAERAVQTLEKRWHAAATITQGTRYTKQLPVPDGATALRVMLVWDDEPSLAALGQPAEMKKLVNDLDLSLTAGSNSFHPWVLDPKNVEQDAVRGRDALNNMEQITISSSDWGANKSVEISVKGESIPTAEVPFALVWWFETASESRIVYPLGGEVFTSGQQLTVRFEGVEQPRAEISWDGGRNYADLPILHQRAGAMRVQIPSSVPISNAAYIRLVGKDGVECRTQAGFSVVPTIEQFALRTPGYDVSDWYFDWDSHPQAEHGYAVLAASSKDESYRVVGHTESKDATRLNLTLSMLEDAEPYFAIAPRFADGSHAMGQSPIRPDVPLPLRITRLPYTESFKLQGSKNLVLAPGASMYAKVEPNELTFGHAAHDLVTGVETFVEDFDTDDFFNPKNAPYISSYHMSGLDLRAIPSTESVVLSFHLHFGHPSKAELDRSRVRFLVDGQVRPDQYGHLVTVSNGEPFYELKYVFKGGQFYVHPELQFAASQAYCRIYLNGFTIARAEEAVPDVSLAFHFPLRDAYPTSKPNLGREPVRVVLRNLTPIDLPTVTLDAYLDGKLHERKTLRNVKGLTQANVEMLVDFSLADSQGATQQLRVEATCPGETRTEDNQIRAEINNYGTGLRHTKSPHFLFDPSESVTISGKTSYYDHSGLFGEVTPWQQTSLTIMPKDPGMRVRIRFHQFDVQGENSGLYVYTVKVPVPAFRQNFPHRAYLTGKIDRPDTLEYVSEADDGALMLHLHAEDALGAGWVATVDLLPAQNPLSLLSASAYAQGTDAEGEVPISVEVKNRWDTKQNFNVRVFSRPEWKQLAIQRVEAMPKGTMTVNFDQKIKLKNGQQIYLYASIDSDDNDGNDNAVEFVGVYDRYCYPARLQSVPSMPVGLQEISIQDSLYTLEPFREYPQYEFGGENVDVDVYRQDRLTLRVGINSPLPEDALLVCWVDWNDDGTYADSERIEKKLEAGENQADLPGYDISGDVTLGLKRMRLAVVPVASSSQGPCFSQSMPWGDIRDLRLNLLEGHVANYNDLEVVAVSIPNEDGNLSNAESVRLHLRNRSHVPYANRFRVKLEHNGRELADAVDCAGEPLQPGQEHVFTLPSKLDMSAKGAHQVRITIFEEPEVVNEGNNTGSVTVHHVNPVLDGQFAIRFDNEDFDDPATQVHLPDFSQFKQPEGGTVLSFETLLLLEHPKTSIIALADGMAIVGLWGNETFADGTLALQLGSNMLVYTQQPVLRPNQWQHIAAEVTIHTLPTPVHSGESSGKLFVDGKEVPCHTIGVGVPKLTNMRLGMMRGLLDEVRIWNVPLKADELEGYQFAHRRQGGQLPEGCLAEFTFDEGVGNTGSVSDALGATIAVKDAATLSQKDAVWYDAKRIIEGFDFDNMVSWRETSEGKYTIKFRATADLSSVSGSVRTLFADAQLTYQGAPITESTRFDFSNPIKIEASKPQIFGNDLTQELELTAEHDLSDACELLSLSFTKAKNPQLQADLAVPVAHVMEVMWSAQQTADLAQLIPEFQLSPYATAMVKGQGITSGSTALDCTAPVDIVVQAPNGTSQRFTLRFVKEQSLTWDQDLGTLAYGDQLPLEAKTTANLPISYTVSNPAVADVTDGILRALAPGTVEVLAQQLGNPSHAATPRIAKTLTVQPRATNVKLTKVLAKHGEPVADWLFEYDNLVAGDDLIGLPSPIEKGVYMVERDGAQLPVDAILSQGQYSLVPTQNPTYQLGAYRITAVRSDFEVVPSDYKEVLFQVVGADEAPVAGATITMADRSASTDAAGQATLLVHSDKSPDYSVEKDGYRPAKGKITYQEGVPQNQRITLGERAITLQYKVAEHAVLVGSATQKLAAGEQGSFVFVDAEVGYQFVRWSDGRTDNPRQDVAGTESATFEAVVEVASYTVSFSVLGDGKWKRGDMTQRVQHGASTAEVETEKLDDGAFFVAWSDGVSTEIRSLPNVQGDVTLTAYYSRTVDLPHHAPFSNLQWGNGWYATSSSSHGEGWQFAQPAGRAEIELDGGYLHCSNAHRRGDLGLEAYLYTPRFAVSKQHDLGISFTYTREGYEENVFFLEYSTDMGQTWRKLGDELYSATRTLHTASVAKADLSGDFIQFRLKYHSYSDYVLVSVDDVFVYEMTAAPLSLTYRAVPAEGGEFSINGMPATTQSVGYGSFPDPVLAEPKAGYRFVAWRHTGSANSLLEESTPVFESRTIEAIFAPSDSHIVTYGAQPSHAGAFLIDGQPAQSQVVASGAQAKPVTTQAMPGYVFLYWAVDGNRNPIRPGEVIANDTVRIAVFEPKALSLTVKLLERDKAFAGANVRINAQTYVTGEDGIARFNLQAGEYPCEIAILGRETTRSVITVKEDNQEHTIQLVQLEVAQVLEGEGTLSITTAEGDLLPASAKLPWGAKLHVVAEPKQEHRLVSLKVNGNDVAADVRERFEHDLTLEVDTQIHAVFGELVTYTVTYEQPANGSLHVAWGEQDVTSGTKVDAGAKLSVTLRPDQGYTIEKLEAGGKDLTASLENGRCEVVVEADLTISAAFKQSRQSDVQADPFAQVRVSPNPFAARIGVAGLRGDERIELHSADGVCQQRVAAEGQQQVDLSTEQLHAGVYLLRVVRASGQMKVYRLVKN